MGSSVDCVGNKTTLRPDVARVCEEIKLAPKGYAFSIGFKASQGTGFALPPASLTALESNTLG